MTINMRIINWKWIVIVVAFSAIIIVMIWKSQQRIRALDRQLDQTHNNHQ